MLVAPLVRAATRRQFVQHQGTRCRRRLRSNVGAVPGLACRRWLSDSSSDTPRPPSAAAAAAAAAAADTDGRTWTWSTPSPNRPGRGGAEIPVIPRVNLTVEEVVKAVEAQGGTDVRAIDLRGKDADMGDFMVFSTAATPLQMRRLANMVVQALKQRKLVNAMGITGPEGIDCDDWMLVDCDNLIVHFMTAEARQELDLETHWETVASGTALGSKRKKGEEGYVEDPVDWEEDFGQEAAKAAGRGIIDENR
ncbi:unnamed protein product [Ectocarpus fasciculatus]